MVHASRMTDLVDI